MKLPPKSSVLAVLGAIALATAGAASPLVRIEAWAINMGGSAPAKSSTVEISIDRWSADEERDRLLAIFDAKGPDALLAALTETKPVGTIRVPGNLAYDLHFARERQLPDGGKRILLATNRRIGFWEVANNSRLLDYPFTLIEIHLDKNGSGVGKLSLATKIRYNKDEGVLELEDFSAQPIRLQNVRVETK